MRVEPWFKLIDWQVQCMQNEIGRFIDGAAGTMPVTEIGRTKSADRITQPVAYRLKLLICFQLHLMTYKYLPRRGSALFQGTLPMNTCPAQSLPDTSGATPVERGGREAAPSSAPGKISIAII